MSEDILILEYRLVKAGYGTLKEVREFFSVRDFIQALHYDGFSSDYEAAFMQVNRKD